MELLKILKALADENRLRILNLLFRKEMCVCEIETVLGITQSNASRHLAKLKEADLIEAEKQGQFIFYFVNSALLNRYEWVKFLLENEASQVKRFQADLEKLTKLNENGMICSRNSCCQK